MSIRIPLTRGQEAIIDDEDYYLVDCRKWYASLAKDTGAFYAKTTL